MCQRKVQGKIELQQTRLYPKLKKDSFFECKAERDGGGEERKERKQREIFHDSES